MNTNAQGLFDNHTTACTGLTCVFWIDGNELSTSFYRFVLKHLSKHPKRRVMCRQGERAASHKRKVQIFNNNCAVPIDQFSGRLMPEVPTLVSDMLIKTGNLFNSLTPARSIALLAGQFAVEYPLLGKAFPQSARIGEPLPIAQGGKSNHANVNPNGLPWVCLWLGIGQFNHQASVPVADMLFDDHMLDRGIARDRAMQADFDHAYMLNVQAVIREFAAVAVVVFNRLKAVATLEARQSLLAFVESAISFVKTAQHLLDRRDIQQSHFIRAIVALLLHPFPLIGVANRLTRALPQPTALVERVIVDSLHLEQNIVQDMQLLRGRTKPILVGQNHSASLLPAVPASTRQPLCVGVRIRLSQSWPGVRQAGRSAVQCSRSLFSSYVYCTTNVRIFQAINL